MIIGEIVGIDVGIVSNGQEIDENNYQMLDSYVLKIMVHNTAYQFVPPEKPGDEPKAIKVPQLREHQFSIACSAIDGIIGNMMIKKNRLSQIAYSAGQK